MKKSIFLATFFLMSVSAFGQNPASNKTTANQDSASPTLVRTFLGHQVQTVSGSKCPEGSDAIGGTISRTDGSVQTDCVNHKDLEKI